MYEVLEETKLISGDRNHSRSYLCLGMAPKELW